jgi:chemotaxis protein CheX
LGNVITGRAIIKLAAAGGQATISPPSLLLGRGAIISTLDFGCVVVPLRSRSGALLIHLALRASTSHVASTAGRVVPVRPVVARE